MANSANVNYNYARVTGAGTAVVHNGACTLQSIVVNTAGTLCTVYDNSAGSGAVVAAITTSVNGNAIPYAVKCGKGITLVTTGATTDITVVFGPA